MDWSSLGALPVGLVFFAGTAFGVLRRRRGHVTARADYPAVATELGLAFRPSRYATGVGTLAGTIEGFKVVVDPDEQRRIAVSVPQEAGIVLHHKVDARRAPPGYSTFRLKNQRAATFFPTCWATQDGAAILGDGNCLEPVVRLLGDLRAVKDVNLTASGVIVSFDFGNPPFIPAEVVRSVVPALIRLAQTLSPR